jgi:hypothetical protein
LKERLGVVNPASVNPDAAVPRPLVALVGCVKTKRNHAAQARDLYVSPLFLGRRAAIEGRVNSWFILSAEHGLVEPSQLIEPYEKSLASMTSQERRMWSANVIRALQAKLGALGGYKFEIHAGAKYFSSGLAEGLRAFGADVVIPTEGMSQGQQLQYYVHRTEAHRATAMPATTVRRVSASYESLREVLASSGAGGEVMMTFAQLETLTGRRLPDSALRYSAWWHSFASRLGWRASPNLIRRVVRFTRPRVEPA